MSVKIVEHVNIKHLCIKNRIFVPPMVTRFSQPDTGKVEQETIDYYRKIAQGGPGLIIQEATCIDKGGRLMNRQLGIWEDEQIDGLHKIVEAVHEECAIFAQIHHAGVLSITEHPVCPDNYKCVHMNGQMKIGQRMTIEEIHAVQKEYVEAVIRAYKAGYDGVELHGCHQYLICQFLNKKVNQRTDEYGTDRLRFVREILEEIHKVVPETFVVGIRLGGFEPTLEDAVEHAVQLEQMGIDFIDVSYGFQMEQEVSCPDDYPFLDIIYATERICQAVQIPVFVANGITSPQMAEEILNHTGAILAGVGRGFIVNPNWMKDAVIGKDTGRCLHCKRCRLYDDPDKCAGKLLFQKNNMK